LRGSWAAVFADDVLQGPLGFVMPPAPPCASAVGEGSAGRFARRCPTFNCSRRTRASAARAARRPRKIQPGLHVPGDGRHGGGQPARPRQAGAVGYGKGGGRECTAGPAHDRAAAGGDGGGCLRPPAPGLAGLRPARRRPCRQFFVYRDEAAPPPAAPRTGQGPPRRAGLSRGEKAVAVMPAASPRARVRRRRIAAGRVPRRP